LEAWEGPAARRAAAGVVHADGLVWSAGIGFADVGARRLSQLSTL
jgi:hypothetical protein